MRQKTRISWLTDQSGGLADGAEQALWRHALSQPLVANLGHRRVATLQRAEAILSR
jgi:hypothetical protein